MNLALKSSPGFREKLAEREESTLARRPLFKNGFLKPANIGPIKNHADYATT
jgi:hypothetical protein